MFMREKKMIEFFNGYNAGGKHVERICVMSENKKRPPASGAAAGLVLSGYGRESLMRRL